MTRAPEVPVLGPGNLGPRGGKSLGRLGEDRGGPLGSPLEGCRKLETRCLAVPGKYWVLVVPQAPAAAMVLLVLRPPPALLALLVLLAMPVTPVAVRLLLPLLLLPLLVLQSNSCQ